MKVTRNIETPDARSRQEARAQAREKAGVRCQVVAVCERPAPTPGYVVTVAYEEES